MAQEVDPTDPKILLLASAFLVGFAAEVRSKHWSIERLEDDVHRLLLAIGDPDFAKGYESRTRQELLSNTFLGAIAVGVAAALKAGLENP